ELVLKTPPGVLGGPQPADAARAAGGVRRAVAAVQDRVLALRPAPLVLVVGGGLGLRQVTAADTEVEERVKRALPCEFLGLAEQPGRGPGPGRGRPRRGEPGRRRR